MSNFEAIENLEQFEERFPDSYWLEDTTVNGITYQRMANGEGESSPHESEWFCTECGALVSDPYEECEICGEEYDVDD